MGIDMLCKSCASVNQKKFAAEISLHFPELKDIDKPGVLVYPQQVVVCLDCGMANFPLTKDELHQLESVATG